MRLRVSVPSVSRPRRDRDSRPSLFDTLSSYKYIDIFRPPLSPLKSSSSNILSSAGPLVGNSGGVISTVVLFHFSSSYVSLLVISSFTVTFFLTVSSCFVSSVSINLLIVSCFFAGAARRAGPDSMLMVCVR